MADSQFSIYKTAFDNYWSLFIFGFVAVFFFSGKTMYKASLAKAEGLKAFCNLKLQLHLMLSQLEILSYLSEILI